MMSRNPNRYHVAKGGDDAVCAPTGPTEGRMAAHWAHRRRTEQRWSYAASGRRGLGEYSDDDDELDDGNASLDEGMTSGPGAGA